MEVEFLSFGDAASRLGVPGPTLRGWADKLEELGIHYLERNNRGERIFYDIDMEIFAFIRDQKDAYGRKATTHDLAYVVESKFNCRKREDVKRSEKLLAKIESDLKLKSLEQLMQHEAFKKMIAEMVQAVNEATISQISTEFENRMENKLNELNSSFQKKLEDLEKRRVEKLDQVLHELRQTLKEYNEQEQKKPWYKRIFG